MSTAGASLHGFAYGEQLDGVPPRSLGFGLLAPAAPEPWATEIETLARRLHATPYPDAWPVTDLFCSVLLTDGRRVVAVARYGVADHTASRRRGGLELVGVVAPGNLGTASALAIYRWLRAQRAQTEDFTALGREYSLADVLTAAPPGPLPEPPPVVPIRVWQDGVFLFAATTPADPDTRLGLLTQEAGAWQWLPLCGVDFPFQTYARRGPLVAWTPHLADVAVKLGHPPAEDAPPRRPLGRAAWVLAVVLLLLLAANLWALLTLPGRLSGERPTTDRQPLPGPAPAPATSSQEGDPTAARERFALALARLLSAEPTHSAQLTREEKELLDRYRRLAKADADLRVDAPRAQAAIGLVDALGRLSPDRVARIVQEELQDVEIAKLIAERVRARLNAEGLRRGGSEE